jgi:uncharacterized protein YcfJ
MAHQLASLSVAALTVGLSTLGTVAMAQEVARVISSTPVVQQVAVPRQVCTNQAVGYTEPKSGVGAVMGAVAGAGLGNAFGQGGGRALATAVGVIGGAMVGNNIEGSNTQVHNVQQCSTQNFYDNRTVGYNVVYEYGGKQYAVQMPNDPGATVQLQLTPVGALNGNMNGAVNANSGANVAVNAGVNAGVNMGTQPPVQGAMAGNDGQTIIYGQPTDQPIITNNTTYVVPGYAPGYAPGYGPGYATAYPPVYSSGYGYAPYYAPVPVVTYPRYIAPAVGISLGFGYRGGFRGGYHHRR